MVRCVEGGRPAASPRASRRSSSRLVRRATRGRGRRRSFRRCASASSGAATIPPAARRGAGEPLGAPVCPVPRPHGWAAGSAGSARRAPLERGRRVPRSSASVRPRAARRRRLHERRDGRGGCLRASRARVPEVEVVTFARALRDRPAYGRERVRYTVSLVWRGRRLGETSGQGQEPRGQRLPPALRGGEARQARQAPERRDPTRARAGRREEPVDLGQARSPRRPSGRRARSSGRGRAPTT